MLTYLEVPDLHFDPQWADVTEQVAKRIAEEAKTVDFIALPGDITNRAIMASESGGINRLRHIIKILTNASTVVAVYGTPSHEPPGSLEHLRDLGLVILEPGKTYGYYAHEGWVKENPSSKPSCLLFGIPELSKKTIQAQLGLSAEEANAEAVNLLRAHVEQCIAPSRAQYPDTPAILLMHGNFSDSHHDNETDLILKASDIVAHSDDFRPANLDRITLGHIHKPWESRVTCAGYAGFTGIDGNPWGNRDFVPAMNRVSIDGAGMPVKIERVPYGTPERRKITKPLASYDTGVAYWLESSDPGATLPENIHPWSRVTTKEIRQETRRVTQEVADQAKSLRDIFKLAVPDAQESVLAKVDSIETAISKESSQHVDLRIIKVEVEGCVLFGGRRAALDIDSLGVGPTAITGSNGSGKSSILAFCSPYPVIVGKDTDSGRPSAIKDFFKTEPAKIRKIIEFNGQMHEHLITIKAPHTQNPKTECYVTVDGIPALDKGTFDEMMAWCEAKYGSFSDYLVTTFYVQPQQSKHPSGLMSATMTDIRDLVQSIAGIDREAEKRHALDEAKKLSDEADRLKIWLDQSSEFTTDISILEESLAIAINTIETLTAESEKIQQQGKLAREAQAIAATAVEQNKRELERKAKNDRLISDKLAEIARINLTIQELQALAGRLDELEAKIKADDEALDHNRLAENVASENASKRRAWQSLVDAEIAKIRDENHKAKTAYLDAVNNAKMTSSRLTNTIDNAKSRIQSINVGCPKCGYIKEDLASEIETLTAKIETAKAELAAIVMPSEPTYTPEVSSAPEPSYEPELTRKLTLTNRHDVAESLKMAQSASIKVPVLQDQAKVIATAISELEAESYSIDHDADSKFAQATERLNAITEQYREVARKIGQLEADKITTEGQIAKSREFASKVDAERSRLAKIEADADEWSYIARMFMPAKIPALELELVADTIDAEATRTLEPFEAGRFSYRTETQSEGKAGTVDRFDVLVHDAETGEERSLLKFSPGQKAFLSDGYVKALVRQRNNRQHRKYDPVIMDESDGPIDPTRIAAYYEIQRTYWTNNRVLVVSHNPTSHEHIEQSIDIKDIVR